VPAETSAPQPDPRQALIEILRDDAAREALIAELERLSEPASVEAPVAEPAVSFSRRIATITQETAQDIAEGAADAWRGLTGLPERFGDIGARELEVLVEALRDLALVIAATVVSYFLLRSGAKIAYRRIGARTRNSGRIVRWFAIVISGLIDAGVVVLAWGLGYAIAVTVIGAYGEVGLRQTLYLNAFLAVEMLKVAVRLVLSPSASELRPVAVSDEGAHRFYRILNVAVSIAGYGLLLLVPIINASASDMAGQSLSGLIVLATGGFLAWAVLSHRAAVSDWLLAQGRTPLPPTDAGEVDAAEIPSSRVVVEGEPGDGVHLAREPKRRGVYAILVRNWHWIALSWLAYMLVTVLLRSTPAAIDALRVSLALGGGAVLAIVLSGAIGRAIGKGIKMPARVTERLPRLEARLNAFVPQLLVALRVLLVGAILLGALGLSGVIDLGAWFGSPVGLRIVSTLAAVTAILIVAFAIWLALTSWVEFRLNPEFGTIPTPREQTLLTLLRNAATIVLLVITLMFALSELGLDIGPLLASAGVLGLAIGFGAQKLVQDVITGIFIQLENAMNVGDVVTAGPTTGVVEKLTIRSVSLRDLNGIYHLIPFSSVDAVSNFTRDFSNYVLDMGIAYREDIEDAKAALFDAFDELRQDPEQAPNISGDLEWFGLDRFGDSAIIVRARIKTLPGKQWGVGRAFNGIVKRIFDERGIEIPFPHTTVYLGENKKGKTQPLHVVAEPPATPREGGEPS
jgi:moderate conductance mechanosensitive channel